MLPTLLHSLIIIIIITRLRFLNIKKLNLLLYN